MKRVLRAAAVAATLATAFGGVAVVGASPAFADGAAATTVTVAASHTTQTSGHAVSFAAQVLPVAPNPVAPTGNVTWTVTDKNGTVIPCTSVWPVLHNGNAKCRVLSGLLVGANSPYTATAVYPGDATYQHSSGTASVTVTAATTSLKLALDAVPSGGAATVATATLVGGAATALLTGTVIFTITSGYHTAIVGCTGTATGKGAVLANDTFVLANQSAVCNLPSGWMNVPTPSRTNPHPMNKWSISAIYIGNGSFVLSRGSKSGTARA